MNPPGLGTPSGNHRGISGDLRRDPPVRYSKPQGPGMSKQKRPKGDPNLSDQSRRVIRPTRRLAPTQAHRAVAIASSTCDLSASPGLILPRQACHAGVARTGSPTPKASHANTRGRDPTEVWKKKCRRQERTEGANKKQPMGGGIVAERSAELKVQGNPRHERTGRTPRRREQSRVGTRVERGPTIGSAAS